MISNVMAMIAADKMNHYAIWTADGTANVSTRRIASFIESWMTAWKSSNVAIIIRIDGEQEVFYVSQDETI